MKNRFFTVFLEDRSTLLSIFDVLSTLVALVICRPFFQISGDMDDEAYRSLALLVIISQILVFGAMGLYRAVQDDNFQREIIRTLSAWIILLLWLLILSALAKVTARYPRSWFTIWGVTGLLTLLSLRTLLDRVEPIMQRKSGLFKTVIAIGDAASLTRLFTLVRQTPKSNYRISGYFCERRLEDLEFSSLQYLGHPHDVGTTLMPPHRQIWLAFGTAYSDTLRAVLSRVQHLSLPVRLVPNLLEIHLVGAPVSYAANITMFDLNSPPIGPMGRTVKFIMDFFGALVGLILLAPFFLIIVVGIGISSPGPVLFRQKREGFNGDSFDIYKFRTMHAHVSAQAAVQATKNDPRVFPFGSFLRKYSLDELPQLINVLRGEMSLVGPRPHPHELSNEFRPIIDFYGWRHILKPGITGWAQVNGLRGETDTREKMRLRVEHDLYYIRNWSLWLDVEILLLTIVRGFFHPNAY